MRLQELIELLQQEASHKVVYIDTGDDSVDIIGVEDFNDYILITPECCLFQRDDEDIDDEDNDDEEPDCEPLVDAIKAIEDGSMELAISKIREFLATVGVIES